MSILQFVFMDHGVECLFKQYFRYIVVVSFIGGGNRSTRRKPPTCHKSLTNYITKFCIEYTSPWMGFELTTLVVINIDSCKPKYHAITTMTAPPLSPMVELIKRYFM